jgi:23S rRNA (cytidine2498-2'-O)-methyltransferase
MIYTRWALMQQGVIKSKFSYCQFTLNLQYKAMKDLPRNFTAYLAPEGFVHELVKEIGIEPIDVFERLVLMPGGPRNVLWAENVWLNPQWIEISSIGDAAQKLKAIQRNWANYAFDFHRRSSLITEKLPHVSAKPLKFPCAPITAPLGSWALIDNGLMLASSRCTSTQPNGAYVFEENKEDPPNRAYLKLWETLVRLQKFPQAGETCLDLGASPGGWTWVLQTLGANVISVDKAALEPRIAALPNVKYVQQSAFALEPRDIGAVDWLFSDIICYPERLLRLVENWRASGLVKNMVCTIKFQGETDYDVVQKFRAIPGSTIMHLHNNKHELTWVNLAA